MSCKGQSSLKGSFINQGNTGLNSKYQSITNTPKELYQKIQQHIVEDGLQNFNSQQNSAKKYNPFKRAQPQVQVENLESPLAQKQNQNPHIDDAKVRRQRQDTIHQKNKVKNNFNQTQLVRPNSFFNSEQSNNNLNHQDQFQYQQNMCHLDEQNYLYENQKGKQLENYQLENIRVENHEFDESKSSADLSEQDLSPRESYFSQPSRNIESQLSQNHQQRLKNDLDYDFSNYRSPAKNISTINSDAIQIQNISTYGRADTVTLDEHFQKFRPKPQNHRNYEKNLQIMTDDFKKNSSTSIVESIFKDYDKFDTPSFTATHQTIDYKQRQDSIMSQNTSPTRVQQNQKFESLITSKIEHLEDAIKIKRKLEQRNKQLRTKIRTNQEDSSALQKVHQVQLDQFKAQNASNNKLLQLIQKVKQQIVEVSLSLIEQRENTQNELIKLDEDQIIQKHKCELIKEQIKQDKDYYMRDIDIQKSQVQLINSQIEEREIQIQKYQVNKRQKQYIENDKVKIAINQMKRLDIYDKLSKQMNASKF
ncbi:UNKNOWN [Stylonychia lemnae]|uniref:Uncharacterized protein n=1 Tax=Stylonychia lemnae TaxID=5949 RepID=A0A078AMW6_STYLE|nr:UNKNOWN [Stylonychia lemnae]|eukprot:CDW82717.1 UNKNOWN [Stylonychia lemnae]